MNGEQAKHITAVLDSVLSRRQSLIPRRPQFLSKLRSENYGIAIAKLRPRFYSMIISCSSQGHPSCSYVHPNACPGTPPGPTSSDRCIPGFLCRSLIVSMSSGVSLTNCRGNKNTSHQLTWEQRTMVWSKRFQTSRLDLMRCGFELFASTTISRCTSQLTVTCPTVVLCFSAICAKSLSLKNSEFPWPACGRLSQSCPSIANDGTNRRGSTPRRGCPWRGNIRRA